MSLTLTAINYDLSISSNKIADAAWALLAAFRPPFDTTDLKARLEKGSVGDTRAYHEMVMESIMGDYNWKPEFTTSGDLWSIRQIPHNHMGMDEPRTVEVEKMLATLAPYWKERCFIDFEGEDGEHWRLEFLHGKMYRRAGQIVYGEPEPWTEE